MRELVYKEHTYKAFMWRWNLQTDVIYVSANVRGPGMMRAALARVGDRAKTPAAPQAKQRSRATTRSGQVAPATCYAYPPDRRRGPSVHPTKLRAPVNEPITFTSRTMLIILI